MDSCSVTINQLKAVPDTPYHKNQHKIRIIIVMLTIIISWLLWFQQKSLPMAGCWLSPTISSGCGRSQGLIWSVGRTCEPLLVSVGLSSPSSQTAPLPTRAPAPGNYITSHVIRSLTQRSFSWECLGVEAPAAIIKCYLWQSENTLAIFICG